MTVSVDSLRIPRITGSNVVDISLPPTNPQGERAQNKTVFPAWVEFAQIPFDKAAEQSKHRRFGQTDSCHNLGQAELRTRVSKNRQDIDGAC